MYGVRAQRWFGRGRVLCQENTTGFTAAIRDLLPGEHAEVCIENGLLRDARVVHDSITDPSPWRISAPCPQAERCPGCTLQHVNARGRENYHQTLIQEVLQRFGGFAAHELPPITVHRGAEGEHRMRTRLWMRPIEEARGGNYVRWEVGMRPRHHRDAPLVDFGRCIANHGVLQRAAQRLQSLSLPDQTWRRIEAKEQWIELSYHADTLWVNAPAWPVILRDQAIAHLRKHPAFETITIAEQAENAPWSPVNPPMQHALYRAICAAVDVDGKVVFDLTCGDGGATYALARAGAIVYASDRYWPAVQRTQKGAEQRGLTHVHTRGGDAEAVLKGARRRGETPDILLINPMREPVGIAAMHAAHNSGAQELFYLAPAPKAGAKDLGVLRDLGWTIVQSDAFVLHPWTGQSMLFAWIRKNAEARCVPSTP